MPQMMLRSRMFAADTDVQTLSAIHHGDLRK
jgi:hypothetical protein